MQKQSEYRETLDFLYSQLPMFQRIGPAALKKDLSNIRALCAELGQPQERFPSIHIGGTNGKGSAAHMLAAVLQAAGYKVGLYTSPHYRDFRERIKVNGKLASRRFVIGFVRQYRHLFESIQPSFFEITVAMAFEYFAREKVDAAVVEVGLGGRLDSTNILHPRLCIITNISFDHMDFLGDTLPLIAAEKAGIIKRETPVVIGESHPETAPVFKAKAREMGAPLIFADEHYQALALKATTEQTAYDVRRNGESFWEGLEVNLHGPYQARNLQTVLQALEWLPEPWEASRAHIRAGLGSLRARTRLMGRWQLIGEKPLVLCDSAHNEAGMQLAMAGLAGIPHRQLHIVMGSVSDKDPVKLLKYMPQAARFYFAKPDIPRGLEAALLREKASAIGLKGKAYSSVRNALRAARRRAAPEDLIYVGGSIFVVAEVIP